MRGGGSLLRPPPCGGKSLIPRHLIRPNKKDFDCLTKIVPTMFHVYIDDLRTSPRDNSPLPDSGRFFTNGVLVTELIGNHLYNTIRALEDAGHTVVTELISDVLFRQDMEDVQFEPNDCIGIGCV